MDIITYDGRFRDDMIFMVLSAKDDLGRVPSINPDLLDVEGSYLAPGYGFWLAVEGGRVVGCMGYNEETPGTARLRRLYVKPQLKRQGIGSALLRTVETRLRERGYKYVIVHLGGPEYRESRAFYPARGYAEFRPRYMRKEL